jgi:hypothetical protein
MVNLTSAHEDGAGDSLCESNRSECLFLFHEAWLSEVTRFEFERNTAASRHLLRDFA